MSWNNYSLSNRNKSYKKRSDQNASELIFGAVKNITVQTILDLRKMLVTSKTFLKSIKMVQRLSVIA